MQDRPKKLLDQVRDRIRLKHYSLRTEKSYVSWIKRFILYHDKRHPKEMREKDIEAFLMVEFIFRMHWKENTKGLTGSGAGNMCFLQKVYQQIPGQE